MVERMDVEEVEDKVDMDKCPVKQEESDPPTQEQNQILSPPPAKPKSEPNQMDIQTSLPEGYNYSYFENFSEDNMNIFEFTRHDTLKRMARQHKDIILRRAMRKAIFIREKEIPMPMYDPDLSDPVPSASIIAQRIGPHGALASCPKSPCALGCVCPSINCVDMYEENYEKHCRDTGDPDCIYGCICNKSGESKWPNSLPFKYKRQKFRDDEECGFVPVHLRDSMRDGRPKRNCQPPTRFRPDFHTTSNSNAADALLSNGNGFYGSNGNGFSRRSSRQRRLLDFESMDVDYGEDGDEDQDLDQDSENSQKGLDQSSESFKKSAAAKLGWKTRRRLALARAKIDDGHLSTRSNSAESGSKKRKLAEVERDSEDETTATSVDDISTVPKSKRKHKRRRGGGRGGNTSTTSGRMTTRRSLNPSSSSTSLPAKRRRTCISGSYEDGSNKMKFEPREPSKRERKPRNLDLPEPEVRPKRARRVVNGQCHIEVPVQPTRKQETKKLGNINNNKESVDIGKHLSQGIPLHVIPNQPASKSCRGMYTILRGREIIGFVTWDTGENGKPFLEETDFNYTQPPGSACPNPFSIDILQLPYVKSEDTFWIFYFLKSHYTDSQFAIFPELHSLVNTVELDQRLKNESIEENLNDNVQKSLRTQKASRIVDISDLNVNVPEDPNARGHNLFAFIGKDVGFTIIFGCPPQVFREKQSTSALTPLTQYPNILFRGKTQGMRRKRARLSVAAQTPVLPPLPTVKNESPAPDFPQESQIPPPLPTPSPSPSQVKPNVENNDNEKLEGSTKGDHVGNSADLTCNSPMPPSTPPEGNGVESEIPTPPLPLTSIVQLPQEIETI